MLQKLFGAKTICLALALPALLCGCDKSVAGTATSEDYAVVQAEIKKNDNAGLNNPIIATGERGYFLIKIAATDKIKAIGDKKKTAMFLSVEQPWEYLAYGEGYCLVNIIPYNTMKAMGAEHSTCHYRLFCGAASEVNYDEMYAVELCK
ncbi:MAG: hypothetical protein LBF37_00770 [Rickettsiales bacterium]|jgi:hypothetical protein|nr:hypothetical protein [Rickettsiales bacterium]